jgi:GrpB-like predicted nucleotidyltransferase (UPF0157 family)
MEHVVIVEYDPKWPELFEQEATRLRNLLGDKLALRVEHVGSTAIPGMPAKPVIDMLVEIPAFDRAKQEALPVLKADGFAYCWRDDRPPGHMMLIKGLSPNGSRTHHLHMAPAGHKLWELLYFRDYLRSHPDEALRYEQLKRDLVQRFPGDREAYTQGKGEYVQMITARALDKAQATQPTTQKQQLYLSPPRVG